MVQGRYAQDRIEGAGGVRQMIDVRPNRSIPGMIVHRRAEGNRFIVVEDRGASICQPRTCGTRPTGGIEEDGRARSWSEVGSDKHLQQ